MLWVLRCASFDVWMSVVTFVWFSACFEVSLADVLVGSTAKPPNTSKWPPRNKGNGHNQDIRIQNTDYNDPIFVATHEHAIRYQKFIFRHVALIEGYHFTAFASVNDHLGSMKGSLSRESVCFRDVLNLRFKSVCISRPPVESYHSFHSKWWSPKTELRFNNAAGGLCLQCWQPSQWYDYLSFNTLKVIW